MFFGKEAANGGAGLLGITGIGVASGVFAFAIYFLELFVATLQAFIFMFLTAVYIRLLTHEDHGEHEHGDHAVPVDDPVAEVAAA